MKDLSVKTLKKERQTLVTYGQKESNFINSDPTGGTDPTTTTFTILTTASGLVSQQPQK